MSERNKKGNDRLSDFIRYRENKMTASERNAFERSLQKDPFAEEASEGLDNIDPSLAGEDISKLRIHLKRRASRKQRVFWYRIAASVAVLMVLSSIFIFINKRSPSEQLSYTPVTEQSKDLQTLNDQPATETNIPPAVSVEKKLPSVAGPDKSIKSPVKTIENEIKPDEKLEKNREEVSVVNKELLEVPVVAQPDQVYDADKAMAAKSARTIKTADTITGFKPDTSDISLNEVVVVGYGVKSAGNEEEAVPQYTPPLPMNGRTAFNRYVQENIRRPDTSTTGQRVVVVLNFKVNENGKIDSISVVRSPGSIFSNEAIRLIREGPSWNPAEENGKVISDEVRIRIVFK